MCCFLLLLLQQTQNEWIYKAWIDRQTLKVLRGNRNEKVEEERSKKEYKRRNHFGESFISFVRKVCTQNHTFAVKSAFSLQYIYPSCDYKKVGKRSIHKNGFTASRYTVYKDDGPLVFVHTNGYQTKLASFLLFSGDCIYSLDSLVFFCLVVVTWVEWVPFCWRKHEERW